MSKQRKVAGDKSPVVAALPHACMDETAAVEFMETRRWGTGAEHAGCPTCGSADVYQMKGRDGLRSARYLWRCKVCDRQFTVRTGTVFEDSKIPLRHWCHAFWSACSSKKGVSALQIKRETGLSYKSALFMMHRIRWAMSNDRPATDKLTGTVEADETFVGGKPRIHTRESIAGCTEKIPVMAMVQRNGNARCYPLSRVTAKELRAALVRNVDAKATLMTDQYGAYKMTGRRFAAHKTVNHSIREYARGDAHTNTVESFFSLLKRGIMGTFHSVSEQHLHRYCDEFEFRWNTRKVDDGARLDAAIKQAEGKRLTYRQQIGKAM